MPLGNLCTQGVRIACIPLPAEGCDGDLYLVVLMLLMSVTVCHNLTLFIFIIGKQAVAYY
jgi:hypothetical protein